MNIIFVLIHVSFKEGDAIKYFVSSPFGTRLITIKSLALVHHSLSEQKQKVECIKLKIAFRKH